MKKHTIQEVKENNKKLILDLVLANPGISRLELTQSSGLSGGSITALVVELLKEGKLQETNKRPSTGGRTKVGLEVSEIKGKVIIFEIKQRSLVFKIFNLNNALIKQQIFNFDYLNGNIIVETIVNTVQSLEIQPKKIGVLIEENIQDSEIRYMVSTSISSDSIALDVAIKMFLDVDVFVDRSLRYLLSEEIANINLEKMHLYSYISVDEDLHTSIFNQGEQLTLSKNKNIEFSLTKVLELKGKLESWQSVSHTYSMMNLVTQAMDVKREIKSSSYKRFVKSMAEAIEIMLLFYPLDAIFLVGKAALFPSLDQDIYHHLQQSSDIKGLKLIQTILPSSVDVAKNMNRILVKNQLIGGNRNVG